ncbi:NAD(P)H-dependent flavin oxidoreductase [Staphylococcus equorum]|uniref:NAD(P)H-dependent flavin oxidoreductase n=1 Tax=Staphylococcus equorum TaxID=246432 RepID=UPI000806407A|nr:nitronate monooxygenase family protein [Staphylococcus equorum]ANQ63722.1 nitronate monooxygenase [Staphylococcus equorum]
MKLSSRITEVLSIRFPILQAGMAGNTTPELVATVSNSGGLGSIGAGYFTPERLEKEITYVQQLTDLPYAVNLFVPSQKLYIPDKVEHMNAWLKPYRRAFNIEEPVLNMDETHQFNHAIDVVIEKGVPVVTFTFGIPDQTTIAKLKEKDITIVGTATSVDEAIANESAGVDAIIAQGSEAGGHRGSFTLTGSNQMPLIGTMSLVPQIADAIDIPIIASGGIMDGRGLVASIVLGAEAIQMGTAFLTTEESGASSLYKNMIQQSKETDTVITNVFTGKPARGIDNNFIHKMDEYNDDIPDYPIQNQLTSAIRKEAAQKGDAQWTHLWSGQSPRLAQNVSATLLIQRIINESKALLNN